MSMFYKEKSTGDFYHGDSLRHRDELKRHILKRSDLLQAEMTRLEKDLGHSRFTRPVFQRSLVELLWNTLLMIDGLNTLVPDKYHSLYDTQNKIESAVWDFIKSETAYKKSILGQPLFHGGGIPPPEKLVGGKALGLARLLQHVPEIIPQGFTITSEAYYLFMEENHLNSRIHALMADLDVISDRSTFRYRTQTIRDLILNAKMPESISAEIRRLANEIFDASQTSWAVRSSCVGEDGRRSFAGLFDSILNVPMDELEEAYRRVLAGRFTDRAIYYRMSYGFREVDTPMAVLFMPMLEAKAAGIMYTGDPRGDYEENIILNSVWGLAADLMGGRTTADTFVVSKSDSGEILEQSTANKSSTLVATIDGNVEHVPQEADLANSPSLSSDDIARLAKIGIEIEEYFGSPQDIEWVIDEEGNIFIVQSRRLQVRDRRERAGGPLPTEEDLLLEGAEAIFPGWSEGAAFTPDNSEDILNVPSGAILVSPSADSEILQVLPHIAGLIVEAPELTAMLAARVQEFGLPCVVTATGAVENIKGHDNIILDSEEGRIYHATNPSDSRYDAGPPSRRDKSNPLHDLVFAISESHQLGADKCHSMNDIIQLVRFKVSAFDPVSGKEKN